jgi:hypothetical protein
MIWTKEEEQLLKEKYMSSTTEYLQQKIKRSVSAIRKKANRINIKRPTNFGTIMLVKKVLALPLIIYDKNDSDGHFLSGLVAGEGSFVITKNKGYKTLKFRLAVEMSIRDKEILYKLKNKIGAGNFCFPTKRKEKWSQHITFSINSYKDIYQRVIPFFETYLLRNTHKEKQFNIWKKEFYKQLNQLNNSWA